MTPEQQAQWQQDIADYGEDAYKLWEYCLMEDQKNGKYWRSLNSNRHHAIRNRECRRKK
jgi:hypothetical protein